MGELIPPPQPVTIWLDAGDLGYIVDALLDSAERRREKGSSRLQDAIADHLDDLAIRLHEIKPAGLTREPGRR